MNHTKNKKDRPSRGKESTARGRVGRASDDLKIRYGQYVLYWAVFFKTMTPEQRRRGVVVYIRVSSKGQEHHIPAAEAWMRHWITEVYGVRILFVFDEIAKGHRRGSEWRACVAFAKLYDIPIVVENFTRLLRHPKYHSHKNYLVLPTIEQVDRLLDEADGVPLVSLYGPDLPHHLIQTLLSDRTTETTKWQADRVLAVLEARKRGPYLVGDAKSLKQQQVRPVAERLRRMGWGMRRIANEVGVPEKTFKRWVKEWEQS